MLKLNQLYQVIYRFLVTNSFLDLTISAICPVFTQYFPVNLPVISIRTTLTKNTQYV